MVMLTVIGTKLAKPGMEFTFMGALADCKECKVRNICFHLDKGTRYRVVGSRNVRHDCPMHEEGVVVVQVEPVPRKAVIPKKQAIEGSTISYETPRCKQRSCGNYALCFLLGMEAGQKRKVTEVIGKVECLAGQSRVEVMLE